MSASPPQHLAQSEERVSNCSDLESDTDTSGSESDSLSCSTYKERCISELSNKTESELKPSQQSGLVLSQTGAPTGPSFGSIAVTNCADIHFGNKTYYKVIHKL